MRELASTAPLTPGEIIVRPEIFRLSEADVRNETCHKGVLSVSSTGLVISEGAMVMFPPMPEMDDTHRGIVKFPLNDAVTVISDAPLWRASRNSRAFFAFLDGSDEEVPYSNRHKAYEKSRHTIFRFIRKTAPLKIVMNMDGLIVDYFPTMLSIIRIA